MMRILCGRYMDNYMDKYMELYEYYVNITWVLCGYYMGDYVDVIFYF